MNSSLCTSHLIIIIKNWKSHSRKNRGKGILLSRDRYTMTYDSGSYLIYIKIRKQGYEHEGVGPYEKGESKVTYL